MIDPDNLPEQPDAIVRGVAIKVPTGAVAVNVYDGAGQLLTKVLPAGGPITQGAKMCPVCLRLYRGEHVDCAGCPVERDA